MQCEIKKGFKGGLAFMHACNKRWLPHTTTTNSA